MWECFFMWTRKWKCLAKVLYHNNMWLRWVFKGDNSWTFHLRTTAQHLPFTVLCINKLLLLFLFSCSFCLVFILFTVNSLCTQSQISVGVDSLTSTFEDWVAIVSCVSVASRKMSVLQAVLVVSLGYVVQALVMASLPGWFPGYYSSSSIFSLNVTLLLPVTAWWLCSCMCPWRLNCQ